MTKISTAYRLSALFLVFTLLLLCLAVVPICSSSSENYSGVPSKDADNSPLVSLLANNYMDYQESTAYKYCFLQFGKIKLLNTVICFLPLLLTMLSSLLVSAYYFSSKVFLQNSSVMIAEFLHDKDGMI